MRYVLAMSLVGLLAVAGCERPAARASTTGADLGQPIATGELISGTLWEKPVGSPGETGSNSGSSPAPGSRVQIYASFILVTDPVTGTTQVSPHGWYTDLRFKPAAR